MCFVKVTSGAGLSAEALCAEAEADTKATPGMAMVQVNATTAAIRRTYRFIGRRLRPNIRIVNERGRVPFCARPRVLAQMREARDCEYTALVCFTGALAAPVYKMGPDPFFRFCVLVLVLAM